LTSKWERWIIEIHLLVENHLLLKGVNLMIIMHNFGDDTRVTDVYVAALEDGTYAVRWDPASKSTLFMDEATLKSKALQAQRKQVMTDNSTFTDAEQFDFSDEELGLVIEEA
jgi:hypothetical protein|tara:strand:- start:152 stop:487 length:336 start_codon:yes stop_codon:yes gene_type:complete